MDANLNRELFSEALAALAVADCKPDENARLWDTVIRNMDANVAQMIYQAYVKEVERLEA